MQEIWRNIQGFPHYQVSNLGRVRSLNYIYYRKDSSKVFHKGQILKQHAEYGTQYKHDFGYKEVSLAKNGHEYLKDTHKLVAKAFIPNPHHYPQINHKNENHLDNRASNLEWCTQFYNEHYGNHGLHISLGLAKHYRKMTDPVTHRIYSDKQRTASQGYFIIINDRSHIHIFPNFYQATSYILKNRLSHTTRHETEKHLKKCVSNPALIHFHYAYSCQICLYFIDSRTRYHYLCKLKNNVKQTHYQKIMKWKQEEIRHYANKDYCNGQLELWRHIPKCFPNYKKYQVSNLGHIRRLPRVLQYSNHINNRLVKGKLISTPNNRWYPTFHGKNVNIPLDRIVARVWCPNPLHYNYVLHINGNKDDNRACNLKWGIFNKLPKSGWHTISSFPSYMRNKYGLICSKGYYKKEGPFKVFRLGHTIKPYYTAHGMKVRLQKGNKYKSVFVKCNGYNKK